MKNSERQINILPSGDNIYLFTKSGMLIAEGYERVVFGDRGPYVEFTKNQIKFEDISIPKKQLYRITDPSSYYIEFRSNDDSEVKVYYQLKTVAYADYKPEYFYISPYDLEKENGTSCIISLEEEINRGSKFFGDSF